MVEEISSSRILAIMILVIVGLSITTAYLSFTQTQTKDIVTKIEEQRIALRAQQNRIGNLSAADLKNTEQILFALNTTTNNQTKVLLGVYHQASLERKALHEQNALEIELLNNIQGLLNGTVK